MATKVVEWDDFTGGYYVGPSATKQPRNTFTGENVMVAMDDATLIPMYGVAGQNLTGTDVDLGVIVNTSWTAVGKPAQLNGMVAFTAKTASAAYLYIITKNNVVVRHTISISGSSTVAAFLCVRPVMVLGDATNDYVDIYIAGDYRQIHRYKVDNAGANIAGSPIQISLSALMTATSDDRLYGICIWGARMVGWSNTSYLYFSNAAGLSSTWAATNYIIVGYNEDRIATIVPRNYDLLIGKPSGWYVVTGVLNYSAAVRQINNGMGILSSDGVAEFNNQVVYNTDTGSLGFPVNLYTVNGARVQPMMFQRFGGNVQNVNLAKGPLGVLQLCLTSNDDTHIKGQLYFCNQLNRWARLTWTTGTSATPTDTVYFYPTEVTQSRTSFWSDPSMYIMEYNQTDKKIALHKVMMPGFEPGVDAFDIPLSGTVLLSDYMSQVPITVSDVYVEVELVELYSSYAYMGGGNIQCKINMKYPPADLAFSVGDVSSTLMNGGYVLGSTIPGTGTRFMGRVYRFRPDNPGYGYGFEVQVNFAGMKLRRVMAVLKEAS